MLLTHLNTLWERFNTAKGTRKAEEIPLAYLGGETSQKVPSRLRHCPVAMKYYHLLGGLNWLDIPDRCEGSYPGFPPASRISFTAAYLIKLDQKLHTLGALQRYLCEHPALGWLLGFGTDRRVPEAREWARILRNLPNPALQLLLDQTLTQIRQTLATEMDTTTLGDVVSLDTKHILAWVRENNPKEFVEERYNKEKQPKGDPDCRLGCKERSNQRSHTPTSEGQPASTISVGVFYWGYASGIVVTKVDGYGEIVLAEYTQPFNAGDTTYFFPLMAQVERRLGRRPRFAALDAAFDAVYVYDYFDQAGGFAAVPRAERGRNGQRFFSPDGLPLCEAGLPMPCQSTFLDRKGVLPQEKGRYLCPLLHPQPTDSICPINHAKWTEGGCLTTLATSPGARIRYQLDRDGHDFKAIYAQRTAAERIFSQATDLGMERPKLRNQAAIANCNTLTYVLLNLRTLQRISRKTSTP